MNREQQRTQAATAWLAEGPARAPESLLAAVLDRSVNAGQRPGWVARLDGTSDGRGRERRSIDLRLAIVVGLVALSMMVAALLAATSHRDDDDLAVLPSPTTRSEPTAGPTTREQTDAPAPTLAPRPSPRTSTGQWRRIESPNLGLAETYWYDARFDGGLQTTSSGLHPHGGWGAGLGGGPPEGALNFWYGSCVDNICGGYVSVTSAPTDVGVAIEPDPAGTGWIRVTGASLDDIEASWAAVYPGSRFSRVEVDGQNGLMATGGGQRVVLAIHAGRAFAIVAHNTIGGMTSQAVVTKVLQGFEFFDPPITLVGEPRTYDIPGEIPGRIAAIAVLDRAEAGTSSVTLAVAYGLVRFDPTIVASAIVSVERSTLEGSRVAALAERGETILVDIQVDGDAGYLFLPRDQGVDSPMALVVHDELVYRIDIVRRTLPDGALIDVPRDEVLLRQFLAGFQALDVD